MLKSKQDCTAKDHNAIHFRFHTRPHERYFGSLDIQQREEGACGIWRVEIDPQKRGKGYGRAMMQDAIQLARSMGFHTIGLNVRSDNEIAKHLYESLGFVAKRSQWGDIWMELKET